MTNYIIENFNFYEELNKNEDLDKKQHLNDNPVDVCLISSEPLKTPYVTLPCKHKFNYESIIDEIYEQKNKRNVLEVARLSNIQIKCPYCRTIHNHLLPCFDNSYVKEKYGSNKIRWVNSPISYGYNPNKCIYTFKTGKNKGKKCNKKIHGSYCQTHMQKITSSCKHEKDKQDVIDESIKNDKNINKCKAILKSGKRKGETCGCKCHVENNIVSEFCKRHLNMLEKESK